MKQLKDNKTPGRKMYAYCADCGTGTKKADTFICRGCSKTLCGKHAVSYVDGNNSAITRNSPNYCMDCYAKQYPADWASYQSNLANKEIERLGRIAETLAFQAQSRNMGLL